MTDDTYPTDLQKAVTKHFRQPPTAEDFRKCGFTTEAINYPLTERGVAALAHINGLSYEQYVKISPAVFFAPNKYMQELTEKRGEAHAEGRLIKDSSGRWVIEEED